MCVLPQLLKATGTEDGFRLSFLPSWAEAASWLLGATMSCRWRAWTLMLLAQL